MNRMLLGFVVRRCAATIGHDPSPKEFAHWANHYRQSGEEIHLFGREITLQEARVILRHPEREVTSQPRKILSSGTDASALETADNVTSLAEFRARLDRRRIG